MDELALSCAEIALDAGMVPTISGAAHTGGDAVGGEQLLVSRGGILTASIRVVQQPRRGFPVRQRHGEETLGEIYGHSVVHRPADHGARVQIEHHGQIEPAIHGRDVGDVPGPHPVRELL